MASAFIPENPYEGSKFRNKNGVRLLRPLFYEWSSTLGDKEVDQESFTLYTLKDVDWKGYPSLYRLYMEMGDVTEYNFATTYFESWDHWETLCACGWFKPYVERWRNELDVRIKAEALYRIKVEAQTNGKNAFMANKYLLEKGWEAKEGKAHRGRHSKDEIKNQAKIIAEEQKRLEDDANRLNLKIN
jgi:hypothetical protein